MLLWVTFHDRNDSFVLLIPVVVMAAGQLAGGLAWLSISGEDAPDLVATAPIGSRRILWAKIEAVIGMITFVFAPIVAVLTLDSVFAGVVCALGILSAAAAATAIQLCFRVQARRSQFRRRQTSSRLATFAEAFSGRQRPRSRLRHRGPRSVPRSWHLAFLAAVWLISPSRA
jgi:ABC-2 type transport system permease protein